MPLSKIVVGTDFSGDADIAVKQALNIARKHGAELVLLHIGTIPERPSEIPPQLLSVATEYHEIMKERLTEVRDKLEQLRERIDGQGARVSQMMIDGFADSGLAEAADELGADLLVVGTHGHTGFKRFVLGSVAQRVVRLATGSVLVARAGSEGAGGYDKILVPIDFSKFTDPAIKMAIDMVSADGQIELFHGWKLPGVTWAQDAWGSEWANLREGIATAADERGLELVDKYSAKASACITFNNQELMPTVGIHDRVDEGHFDLVVMGSHGRKGWKRWTLGSVAEQTVRHAPCSVIVVHVPEGSP